LSAGSARSRAPSDHRKFRAPFVPAESQGSYMHPTVADVASPFLPSISDAKSEAAPKSKIAMKCTAFLTLQTLNSPTRIHEDPQIFTNAELYASDNGKSKLVATGTAILVPLGEPSSDISHAFHTEAH